MAQLMVSSGRSTLPWVPQRVVAVFQPHRFSRTAEFMDRFAAALGAADQVLLAPLYSAGESPIEGVSSAAMADRIRANGHDAQAFEHLEDLADAVMSSSENGDLVLVMGAGDVNRLWHLLQQMHDSNSIAAA
jgi:UDP-N-acetylmuramate--alanine ligase